MGAGRAAAGRRRQAGALTDLIVVAGNFLCRSEEIAEGEARSFPMREGSRSKLILVRRHGALYAYWDACPHYGDTPMAWRTNEYLNAGRDRIVCASHGAEFEIETGRCILGAALGKSLSAAPIEVSAADEVYLSI
jgi:nitrite reductase/ring-hydroxylating ferredoxin subunit